MNPAKTVLILECHRHTLTVARSLARSGYRVIAGIRPNRREDSFLALSRAVAATWEHPDFQAETVFIEELLGLLAARPEIAAIFPTGEASLRLLNRCAHRLPPGCRAVTAAPETGELCLDKARSSALVESLGLPLPRTRIVSGVSGMAEAIREVGLPAIVKPASSEAPLLGKKCVTVETAEELERLFPHWPATHDQLIVQNKITGKRHNCTFIAKDGKLALFFESVVERTHVWDGSGFSVQTRSAKPSPVHRLACERIIAALNYNGLGCIQFLVDEKSRQSYFLEINPRLDATCALPAALGVDFPRGALELSLAGKIPTQPDYAAGVQCQWLGGDLAGLFQSLKHQELRAPEIRRWSASIVRTFLQSRIHATFDWSDPVPTAYLGLLLFRSSLNVAVRNCASLSKSLIS